MNVSYCPEEKKPFKSLKLLGYRAESYSFCGSRVVLTFGWGQKRRKNIHTSPTHGPLLTIRPSNSVGRGVKLGRTTLAFIADIPLYPVLLFNLVVWPSCWSNLWLVVIHFQVVERQYVIPAMFKEVYAKVTVCKIAEKEWEERDMRKCSFWNGRPFIFFVCVCVSGIWKCEKLIFNLLW